MTKSKQHVVTPITHELVTNCNRVELTKKLSSFEAELLNQLEAISLTLKILAATQGNPVSTCYSKLEDQMRREELKYEDRHIK